MLRWSLIRAAENDALATWARSSPIAQQVAYRYIAGETLDDGLGVARRLADAGMHVTMDHVGEHVDDLRQADAAARVYHELLERMAADDLPGGVSVKPTQLGLTLDPEACAKTLEDLAARADGRHVTLDMEDHQVTEATVDLVERMQAAGLPHVGCAVQAYLYRTPEDVRRLTRAGASLRLCKGAYAEPEYVAHRRRVDVERAYLQAARYLLAEGHFPRFATHDHRLVAAIVRHAAELGRDRDTYEFQMLYGVRPDMQRALVRDGYRVCVYVPFGAQWFPYFTRRLAERPANLAFFLRALRPAGSDDA